MKGYVLRWSLPAKRPRYVRAMSGRVIVFTERRTEALVFGSRRAAMLHPANMVPGAGFEPVAA